ncbi:hypothetical protein N7475_009369 [Penicillium sp. IBT 31633x]|nr:hypothetical protein N7475_009369 [Penicillium sp. IBT 31633x]
MAKDEYPPYTPMPSLGHELGLMFGFLALCAIVMAAYVALWRVSQTRLHAQDIAHRNSIRNKTPHLPPGTTPSITATLSPGKDSTVLHEKMLDRFAVPANRAELPVHGMEMYARGRGVYTLDNGNASAPRMSSPLLQSRALSPVSALGGGGTGDAGTGMGSRGVSPLRGGIGLESIAGLALGPGGGRDSPVRVRGGFDLRVR